MTRDELRARLQLTMANNVYYTQDDFNNSIQDAVDEVVVSTGCLPKAVRLSFINNLTYYDFMTLIPDFYALTAIFNIVTKRWMNPNSLRRFDEDRPDWEVCAGTPDDFAVVNHRYTAIYKKPNTTGYGDMFVFYKATAPTLVGSSVLPMADVFTDSPQDYAIADLWEQQQEWTKAGAHFKDYVGSVQRLKEYVNQRIPERLPFLREFKLDY
jgi:hypothetical protein